MAEAECYICNEILRAPNMLKHFQENHPNAEKVCQRCKTLKKVLNFRDLCLYDYCNPCSRKQQCQGCQRWYEKSYCKDDHKKVCKGLKDSSMRTCKLCGETKVLATEFYETRYTCKVCLTKK